MSGCITRMTLPTRQEINPHDDLDGRVACEHFFGKSLEEAEALFHENDIYYQSDLMWMGAPAFRFYLPAVARFIQHETGDISDFVAHFAGTLEFRLEYEARELTPVAPQLVELCDYLLEHWSRFEKGTTAYGDVGIRYMSLRESFSRLAQEAARP
jgi:hypothetical protein